jgi:hypothetical protein
MTGDDRVFDDWAREHREATQATNRHTIFKGGVKGHATPLPGWGGITLVSEDTENGERTLDIRLRPVRLGFVEWGLRLATQASGAGKPHAKRTYIYSTPQALREFAMQLLATADEAEKGTPRPRPVK